ncbi:MAG: hypothetical protein DRI81_16960 [Chloroflexi bacterium]|nr:MAG: hypothetical protein DRI81_16960 [Chloroflexota bacterium]
MDPATIATAVVTFLIPFLVEGGKATAKKGAEALVAALVQRFKDKPAAQEALDDLKKSPQNEDLQAVLRVQLTKTLTANKEFLAELTQLLEQAQGAPAAGIVAQGEGAAAAQTVGGSIVTGGLKLEGGSTFVGGNQTTGKDKE